MRTLYVSFFYPWPGQSGWGRRLANTVDALASLGPVDFICLDASDRRRDPAPPGVRVLDSPEGPRPPDRTWIPAWIRGPLPREIVTRDFAAGAARIPELLEGDYDAVVIPYIHAWPALAAYLPAPVILDLGDLVDDAIRSRRKAGFTPLAPTPGARVMERLRWEVATLADRIDERRYRALQRRAGDRCERVFVCSELDVGRLGLPHAVVIPNGYERTGPPRADPGVVDAHAPVFVLVGGYSYGPNADAARWFATEVLPQIRRRIPGARFRVVGPEIEAVAELAERPGVELVGWVDEVAPEIVGADVVVVPVRFGSGTRLKVVEAMANRVPMVSTTLGCEGIDVVDGEHLLTADTAGAFAEAAVRLITEGDLRASLVDAAEELWEDRYRWSTIREAIVDQVRSVSGVADHRG